MSHSNSNFSLPPLPSPYKDYVRPHTSSDIGSALRYMERRRKPIVHPQSELPIGDRTYRPSRFFHNGRPVPFTVIYGGEVVRGYGCKEKDPLLIRLQNRGDLPMSVAPPIVPHPDTNVAALFVGVTVLSRYYHFIRSLTNDEVDHLVGHFYDRWLWDTNADSDKASFEEFHRERDRRKINGWKVKRPTKREAREECRGTFVDDRTRLYILLSRDIQQPEVMPGYSVQLDLITNIFDKYGILNSPSLVEYIDGFLRRIP